MCHRAAYLENGSAHSVLCESAVPEIWIATCATQELIKLTGQAYLLAEAHCLVERTI